MKQTKGTKTVENSLYMLLKTHYLGNSAAARKSWEMRKIFCLLPPTHTHHKIGFSDGVMDRGSECEIGEQSSNASLGLLHPLKSKYSWKRYEYIFFL